MKNQVLSINQMQELKELGINTSKASMCWSKFKYDSNFIIQAMSKNMFEEEIRNLDLIYTPYDYTIIPTFTLQDILEILPREIKPFEDCKSWKKVWLRLLPYAGNRWCVLYENPDEVLYRSDSENPLESAFNMLKWCKQNNYI